MREIKLDNLAMFNCGCLSRALAIIDAQIKELSNKGSE